MCNADKATWNIIFKHKQRAYVESFTLQAGISLFGCTKYI